MKERLIQTQFSRDIPGHEHALSNHENFAVLRIPDAYGDPVKIQADATDFVTSLDLKGVYDHGYEPVPLQDVLRDVSTAWGGEDTPLSAVISFCADVAKEVGFSEGASLSAMLQSDKQDDENPNQTAHKDGVGSNSYQPFIEGKSIRAVRFVYPIGRPGTTVFPDLAAEGSPINFQNEIIENPSEVERLTSPKFLSGPRETSQLAQAQPFQLLSGAILAFDMTNSPWHVAPEPTVGGAILTVNVFENS